MFLPKKTAIPLREALQNVGLPDIDPDNSDVTVMYMKQNQDKYLEFLAHHAEQTKRTIHIIVPGNGQPLNNPNPDKLQIHTCPFIPQKTFQSLMQHASVPPGTTGNETFLEAIVGETPFFFDGRMHTLPAIKEFEEFASNLEIAPATRTYLRFMVKMAESPGQVSKRELQSMASLMSQNMPVIRSDFSRIADAIRINCNAEIVMTHRLSDRMASETTPAR